jgi:hypothetical protein
VAQRFMWNKISAMTEERNQCSIILTTHSMPEAENLCGRIGIMVDGRMRCLGPAGALRAKFSQGYMAEFKLRPPEPAMVARCMEMLAERPALLEAPGGGGGAAAAAAAAPRGDALAAWALPTDALVPACARLGDPTRVAMIHPEGAGWALKAQFAAHGRAPALQFAEWWRGETLAALLNDWILREFPGSQLLERAGGDFLRFEVRTGGRPLSALFNALEANKERLQVMYYSMSEMSLETVFNAMVSPPRTLARPPSPPSPHPPHPSSFSLHALANARPPPARLPRGSAPRPRAESAG